MEPAHPPSFWAHVQGHTYGSWVRGDRRGWRERHHREHVEGDYRHPPAPGTFEDIQGHSKKLMREAGQRAVYLSEHARRVACLTMVDALQRMEIDVLVACVDACHFHLLARFAAGDARKPIGIMKAASARTLSKADLCEPGGVWAVRCGIKRIKDPAHQRATYRYILRHRERGAYVWTFRDERPSPAAQ